jgi:hypothetical protein
MRFALSNTNLYHNLSYKENLGKGWKLQVGTSYTNNRDKITAALENEEGEKENLQYLEFKNFSLRGKSRYANAKTVAEKRLAG